ncbi:MAG: helix-turn-helix transcriptional regulator [Clostridia bacterium]|nr:helix-turn-helix transcriptional regulator [Clostridia bacterium]
MGERIYAARKTQNMTQEQLAEKIGVSTQMISNLELGKKAIRPENLVKVCAVLNISADYALSGKEFCSPAGTLSQKMVSLSRDELRLLEDIINYMHGKK